MPGTNGHSKDLFHLGQVAATPGALEVMANAHQMPEDFLERHVRGDWGELGQADKQQNIAALSGDDRILSAYTTKAGARIWVITEADRSSTTLLLPEEY